MKCLKYNNNIKNRKKQRDVNAREPVAFPLTPLLLSLKVMVANETWLVMENKDKENELDAFSLW